MNPVDNLNWIEDRLRAATRAQAAALREVRPLRLRPAGENAAGENAPASAGKVPGARRLRSPGWPRSPGWLAPVAAAAVVVALAVALVIVRGVANRPVVPPAGSTSSATAVPPYYAAVSGSTFAWYAYAPLFGGVHYPANDLVVGDTLTGRKLATIASPQGTAWTGVSAAADDRTFVAFAAPATGHTGTAGSWYLIRLTPGAASPAALTALPLKAMSDVVAMALSGSGQELAVATAVSTTAASTTEASTSAVMTLGVYSVTTGRREHEWSTDDQAAFSLGSPIPGVLYPGLTWIDGDRGLAFPVTDSIRARDSQSKRPLTRASVRRVDLSDRDGDLMASSRLIWVESAQAARAADCMDLSVTVSANGRTVSCFDVERLAAGSTDRGWRLTWRTYPAGTTAGGGPGAVVDYAGTVPAAEGPVTGGPPLWVSASGTALLGRWELGNPGKPASVRFGLLSRGTFTALPVPPSGLAIAW